MSQPTIRLTLRTLLAYLDDTLDPAQALVIGQKLSESQAAQELADRIRKITRKRGLSVPSAAAGQGTSSDPNTVAGYLSDSLPPEQLAEYEQICLESDVHLAEVAASHQILTLVLSEQVTIPPTAYRRMYGLVPSPAADPQRKPAPSLALGAALDTGRDKGDDLDMAYLLGMEAYSRSQPLKKRILQGVAAGLLLAGFLIAAYLAWPAGTDRNVAKRNDPAPANTPTRPTEAPPPPAPATRATNPEPAVPVPAPVEPAPKPPVEPNPKLPVEPAPMPKPATAVNWDILPGRVGVAVCDGPAEQLLLTLRPEGNGSTWRRVAPKGEVMTTERLMALPGYRPKLTFETGLTVELWANLPELVPMPVLQTSATPTVAPAGYDADLTLHVGRLFLATTKAGGAKVRVRFANQVWDVTLPDARSAAVVEVLHALTPGPQAADPVTAAVLFAAAGTPTVATPAREEFKVPAGQIVLWSKLAPAVQGPKNPEPMKLEPTADYFERIPVYPNEATATASRKVLDGFAKRLPDAQSVSTLIAETNVGEKKGTPDVFATRFAVFSAGALGEYVALAESINDPDRAFARDAGIVATRTALAADPKAEGPFREAAKAKFTLPDREFDAWMTRLRGITIAERGDPAVYDRMAAELAAPELVRRELAYHFLVNDLDPEARRQKVLIGFDAGAPTDAREASVKAWNKRIGDLKAALKAAPPQ